MRASQICMVISICLFIVLACEAPNNPSYDSSNPDPNPPGTPAAILTGINPSTELPGKTVVIAGSGFNTEPSANLVSFGSNAATVIAATATQLDVVVPFAGGDVNVKVTPKGAEEWSNEIPFEFKSFIPDIQNPEVLTIDEEIAWPMGVAVDAADNVYIGSATDEVIYKISPTGEKTTFATVPIVGAIHFGPDNYLYVCEKWEGKVVRISSDGATIEDVAEVADVVDFDWDANGTMYFVSGDYGIFMMPAGGSVTEVAGDIGSVKSCRVFGDYLYVSKIWDSQIARYEITADGLGDEETYYDADTPSSFDFDVNGVMYWAHAWEVSLFLYAPGGAEEATIYEDELETPMRYMKYHKDKIYIVYPGWADVGKVIRVHIGVDQAPRYGKQ